MTAADFGRRLNGGHSFGIDPRWAAAALRALADRIEVGVDTLKKAEVTSVADPAEFAETVLRLTICERR